MSGCNEYEMMTRRQLIKRGAALGAAISMPAWVPQIALAQGGPPRDTMIMLFLTGGIDGLTLCVPHGDSQYYARRPTLAVPAPDSNAPRKAIDLDGFFGLPPALASLKSIYDVKKLLFVHATGADKTQWTRSHFDAQVWMEAGKTNDITVATGWLGRHLATTQAINPSGPLRGIGFDYGMIDTIRGGPKTLPIPYPEYYGFEGWYPNRNEMIDWLRETYSLSIEPVKSAAVNAISTVDLLNAIDFEHYTPAGGAVYPENSSLGRSLRAVAAMMKAGIKLEAVAIHFGGWDTHENQGPLEGYMYARMYELGRALSAFYKDMFGSNRRDWVLVGMSEFGRNVIENGSRGTDHGTGNAMFLMGGSVYGGKVIRSWPGLARSQLYEGQDLRVTIDYRDILAEVVQKRLKNDNLAAVFPGYTPTFRYTVAP